MDKNKEKTITVYTSDTCPYCRMIKDYLTEKGIAFAERNITRDPSARRILIENEIMGVPATFVDKEIVLGFDKEKIDALLEL